MPLDLHPGRRERSRVSVQRSSLACFARATGTPHLWARPADKRAHAIAELTHRPPTHRDVDSCRTFDASSVSNSQLNVADELIRDVAHVQCETVA